MRRGAFAQIAVFAAFSGVGLAPVAAADFGVLELHTEPGTTIHWDGNELGATADSGRMTIANIPIGGYSITLQHENFETVARVVEIESGSQSLEIPLRLGGGDLTTAAALNQQTSVPRDPVDSSPVSVPVSGLLDPFARRSTPLLSVTFVALLVAVAGGFLWLGRRRRLEAEDEIALQPEGPRVVLAPDAHGRRHPPGFYEDLRERETVLEGREVGGIHRPKPKIIDLPVTDHRPAEGDK